MENRNENPISVTADDHSSAHRSSANHGPSEQRIVTNPSRSALWLGNRHPSMPADGNSSSASPSEHACSSVSMSSLNVGEGSNSEQSVIDTLHNEKFTAQQIRTVY